MYGRPPGIAARELPEFVLPANEPFHGPTHLIGINGNIRLGVSRIVFLVGYGIADFLHVLMRVISNAIYGSNDFGERTSTWSLLQLSMLKDLTLDICVPIFLCNAAQLIQRKIPN